MAFMQRAISFGIIVLATTRMVSAASEPPAVEFARGDGRVTVAIDGLPVAVYCYKDDKITRPFFAHVRAPWACR